MKLEKFMQILSCLKKIANGPPKKGEQGNISTGILKFNYGIGKNIKIAEETAGFKQFTEMSRQEVAGEKNYRLELEKLYKKHCLKDDEGNPAILPEGGYVIPPQNRAPYENEKEEIDEKYSDIVTAINVRQKGLEDLLKDEEIEIEWHKIKLSIFPTWVNGADMSLLMDMIIYDLDDEAKEA